MTDLLVPLGLAPADSAVYTCLFDHPGAEMAEVAEATALPAPRVRRSLDRLLALGLTDRVPGMTTRHLAASPEVAIDAAVLRRQQELDAEMDRPEGRPVAE